MRLSRRDLLKSGTVAAAAVPAMSPAAALVPDAPVICVFDSRIAESRMLSRSGAAMEINVADGDRTLWQLARGTLPKGRVAGVTRWDDLVTVRGLLEGRGKRLRSDVRRGQLHYWDMA